MEMLKYVMHFLFVFTWHPIISRTSFLRVFKVFSWPGICIFTEVSALGNTTTNPSMEKKIKNILDCEILGTMLNLIDLLKKLMRCCFSKLTAHPVNARVMVPTNVINFVYQFNIPVIIGCKSFFKQYNLRPCVSEMLSCIDILSCFIFFVE